MKWRKPTYVKRIELPGSNWTCDYHRRTIYLETPVLFDIYKNPAKRNDGYPNKYHGVVAPTRVYAFLVHADTQESLIDKAFQELERYWFSNKKDGQEETGLPQHMYVEFFKDISIGEVHQ